MLFPKLYCAPMTFNITNCVIEKSSFETPIGFILSRRQIDFNGGYVNNWTTKTFCDYIKARNIICRDHAGPNQGSKEDNGKKSLETDCDFASIIHIDPWKKYPDFKEGCKKTFELIKYCHEINPNCLYEIGTEESIRKFTSEELTELLICLERKLDQKVFDKIVYVVIQCGTKLQNLKNFGSFDEKKLVENINIIKKFSKLSKEHNGDFQSSSVIKSKFKIGLDAINIAPELACIENSCVYDFIKEDEFLVKEIFDLCLKSDWKKWFSKDVDIEKYKKDIMIASCHYIYSKTNLINILNFDEKLGDKIKLKLNEKISNLLSSCY